MSYNFASDVKILDCRTRLANETSKTGARLGKFPLIFLLVFSAFIAVDRVAVPQVPFNVDPASYAVIGHEILQGQSLYTDMWDHKPPAIFIAYGAAELLLGYSPQTLVALNFFVSLVTLFGIYYAGKAGRGGIVSGLLAAALWVIFSATFQSEGRDANTEPFLNACMIWAFALLAAHRKAGLPRKTAIIIGLLFVLGSFFKPIVVAIALFLMCAHVIFSADRKRAFGDALLIGSIGVTGWIALFGYFAATSRLGIFYDTIVSYNRFYSGDMWANLVAPLRHQAELIPDFMNPLALFAVVGTIFALINNRRQAALLVAFIGSSWIAIALPGRFSVHYFQLWLPPLIVAASWAGGFFAVSRGLRLRLVSYAAGAALFATLLFNQSTVYQTVLANEWTPFIPLLNAGDAAAAKINTLLAKDETFFSWGNTPTLYLLTGRRPPTPVLFQLHFEESPVSEKLIKRVKEDMERNRPELLIVESGRPPVPDWMAKDYEPMPIYQDNDTYTFFVRRGGRLASQINSTPMER